MAKLSEICRINMGQSPESSSYNENSNGLPFFQGNADFGEIHPTVRIWCNEPKKIAQCNDILISVRAPIGALNIADTECCIGRGLASLTVNERIGDRKFVWYALESKVNFLVSMGTGSTFKAIGKNVLYDLEIPLPPLETQKQIAANLDKVTHTIDLCNNILEKLDLLVKSRFVEMFGDADRLIDRWKKKKFADVTINLDSTRKPVKDSDRKKMQGEYAYYGATGVVDHVNDYRIDGTYLLISEDGKALEFRNKDIAFIASGKIWVNNHAHVLQCTDEINMIFLISYLNYRDISDWVTGIDQKKLNRANMDKIPVGLPPIELQNQFAAFVEQTDKSKSSVKQVLEKAETLKKALMQEYFG